MASAPRHLSRSSRRLWRQIADDYALHDEPHALEVLRLALEALDRGTEARERVVQDGAYVTNRFGEVRPHPALRVEAESRVQALRAFRELSLDGSDLPDARPPRIGTGARS